jgi:hypothetical protein
MKYVSTDTCNCLPKTFNNNFYCLHKAVLQQTIQQFGGLSNPKLHFNYWNHVAFLYTPTPWSPFWLHLVMNILPYMNLF